MVPFSRNIEKKIMPPLKHHQNHKVLSTFEIPEDSIFSGLCGGLSMGILAGIPHVIQSFLIRNLDCLNIIIHLDSMLVLFKAVA
jgi:hypothetical protein